MAEREATPEEIAAFHASGAGRDATPEEEAAFHGVAGDKGPEISSDTTPLDLRHEAYRGVLPIPEDWTNKIEAFGNAHDPFNKHGTYEEELAAIRNREAAVKQEQPIGSTIARIAGAAAPGGAAIKAGKGLVAGAAGAENALTRIAGSALGAGAQTGAQGGNPLVGAALGAGGQAVGEGASTAMSSIAKRFPWLADRLAEKVTGQKAQDIANRVLNTEKGNFPEGDYADEVLKMGLSKPTAHGTVSAAEEVAKRAGAQLEALRGGKSASVDDVRQILQNAMADAPPESQYALRGMLRALPDTGGGAHTIEGIPFDKLPQAIQAQLSKQGLSAAASPTISLNDLAALTNNHIGDTLKTLQYARNSGNMVLPQNLRTLGGVKDSLNELQRSITEAPEAYDAARKAMAIASGAGRGAAREIGTELARAGGFGGAGYVMAGKEGAMVGLGLGTKSGRRAGAYAALETYNAMRSPALQSFARAAGGRLGQTAAQIAQSHASGQPQDAGVALQKIQANDPAARDKLNNE